MSLAGRVAIVTGAGGGLGREHACFLARKGARVVVNDLDEDVANKVAAEIRGTGGEALAIAASVTDEVAIGAMVEQTLSKWGRVDILVNNAGILRDKSFAKMTLGDFRLVVEVHLMGAVICTKAVWDSMRAQRHGRVIMTTSASGLFGNFGQANYGAAKMALVGLMQTLAIEGEKYGIRVNCLAPTAATQMTQGVLPGESSKLLDPALVSPALLVLAGDDAPTRAILCAGAGHFARASITLSTGRYIGDRGRRRRRGRLTTGRDLRPDRRNRAGLWVAPVRARTGEREDKAARGGRRAMTRDAVIVSTARTPIGRAYRGAFNNTPPPTLAAHVLNAAVSRAGVEPGEVDDCLLGCSLPQGGQHMIGRMAVLRAGFPVTVPGMTLDRQCSSGLMTIATAAKQIIVDRMDIVVAGGVESISLVQTPELRIDPDPALAAMHADAYMPMIETAEVVAARYGIDREQCDRYALSSQQRTAAAQAAGRFSDEIVPFAATTKMVDKASGEISFREVTLEEG